MATQKNLLTPRGYLSWTQIDMWARSRERYIAKYMLEGGVDIDNSGLRFGKRTSDALDGAEDDDEVMRAAVALLPRYKLREHEIKVPMKTQYGTVDLLGKLDTFDSPTPRFREYKTGRTKWTQNKAQSHKQMHHYATLIWLKHGVVPSEAWLDWLQTEEVEGEVRFTGHIQSFHVKLGLTEVLEYMAFAGKVAYEIDQEYRKQLAKLS